MRFFLFLRAFSRISRSPNLKKPLGQGSLHVAGKQISIKVISRIIYLILSSNIHALYKGHVNRAF